MKQYLLVVWILANMAVIHTAEVQTRKCPAMQYYDGVTRSCNPCSDICLHADIQRTVAECNFKCPDYGKPITGSEVADKVPVGLVTGILVPCIVLAIFAIVMTVKFREPIQRRLCRREPVGHDGDVPEAVEMIRRTSQAEQDPDNNEVVVAPTSAQI